MTSVSQAKNIMRRAVSDIVDPGLTSKEKDSLWKHFKSMCAFCGLHIERASRTGHVARRISDGGNGPRNRVLACAKCNGDQKRERDWREFLAEKCPTQGVRDERQGVIDAWVAKHPEREPVSSPDVTAALADAERLVTEFHAACTRLRQALKDAAE